MTVDDYFFGLLADRGKPGSAMGVTIQEAVGDKPLVIHAVRRGSRSQGLDQVRREAGPLGSGDNGCLAPAALPLWYAGQPLVPAEQRRTDAIPITWNTMPAPTGVEFLHVRSRLEIEAGMVALDEGPGRGCRGGSQAPPLIQRPLFRDSRARAGAGRIA